MFVKFFFTNGMDDVIFSTINDSFSIIYDLGEKVGEMVKFRLKEMILKKSYEENRVIHLQDIAKEIGVSIGTVSRIANSDGDYNTTTENLAKLCRYFNCTPNDLMTIVPDPEEEQSQDREKREGNSI